MSLLHLCNLLNQYLRRKIRYAIPCLYWLLYTDTAEYRRFKRVASFLYGVLLGIIFYRMFIKNLQFDPMFLLGFGTVITLLLATGCAISRQIRCITVLTIPSFCSRSGRSVLKVLVLSCILAGPVHNMATNAKEVARVFGCTTSFTFNLTKNRFDMVFRPFQEAVLTIKGDSSGLKDAMKAVKEVMGPVAKEVEGEEEMRRIKEDNDYLDEQRGDTMRSKDIDQKYKAEVGDSKEIQLEKKYRKTLEHRCEGLLTTGSEKCEKAFSNAYDRCYNKVTWAAAWLLCWPMKLNFICNIWQAIGGKKTCDPSTHLQPGFGEGYVSMQKSGSDLASQLKGAKVQYKIGKIPPVLNIRTAMDSAKEILRNFQGRKEAFDAILLLIMRLFTFMFVKIILAAQEYHDKYTSDIEFDNNYITRHFRRIDARRHKKGHHTLLPLKKIERNKFIDPYSLVPEKAERKNLYRQTSKLVLEVVIASAFLLLDRLFYEALELVRRHSYVEYHQEGHHDIKLTIYGTGIIAKLVRKVLKGFNIKKRIKMTTDNKVCLPYARKLPTSVILNIYGFYFLCWITIVGQAFVLRIQRVICSFFYPKREKKRILYIYNEMLKRRRGYFRYMKNRVRSKAKEHDLHLKVNIFMVLRFRYSSHFSWLKMFPAARRKCLICGETEPREEEFRDDHDKCSNPRCYFYHCLECWKDVRRFCYACAQISDDEYYMYDQGEYKDGVDDGDDDDMEEDMAIGF